MTLSATSLGGASASTTNTISMGLTTSGPGRICLLIGCESNSTTSLTITGVSGAGGTWAQRARAAAGTSPSQVTELWYADFAAAISGSLTLTVTFSGNFDDAAIIAVLISTSVSGNNILFDPGSGTLPATLVGSQYTSIGATLPVPFLLLLGGSPVGSDCAGPVPATNMALIRQQQNTGGSNYEYLDFFGGSPVSSGTLSGTCGFTTFPSGATGIVDALREAPKTIDQSLAVAASDSVTLPLTAAISMTGFAQMSNTFNKTSAVSANLAVGAADSVQLPITAAISASLAIADVTFESVFSGPVYARAIVRSQGPGFASFLPPAPLPGSIGAHEYAVLVTDKYGNAYGEIRSAIPTQIDWLLNGLGQALIDFDIMDPTLGSGTTVSSFGGPLGQSILPVSSIPGGREIQVWRDGQLIFWGVPTSVSFDAKQVHLTCQGLLWYVAQTSFGPITHNYAMNPGFEEYAPPGPQTTVPSWIMVGVGFGTYVERGSAGNGFQVLVGQNSVRLVTIGAVDTAYLQQDFTIANSGSQGLAIFASAWFYIDGSFTPGPSNLGIQMFGTGVTVISQGSITPDIAPNQWQRITCECYIPPNQTNTTVAIALQTVSGVIYWDQVNVTVEESVGSPPTGCDAQYTISLIVGYMNDPTRGKSDHAMPFVGPPTGKNLVRIYQFFDNAPMLDALNEYPTIGVCDFEVTWDATGHYRQFQIFPPAKGSYKFNYPIILGEGDTTDLQGSIDGTQAATAVRWLGQGSTGSSQDMGYAAFPSFLGGRTMAGSCTYNSTTVTLSSGSFLPSDVGQPIYCLTTQAFPIGTTITAYVSASQVTISNPAELTLGPPFPIIFGVGGVILDNVQSALPDQLPGTLQGSADNYLQRFLQAQFLPTAKLRADGPKGLFGQIATGDVVPVMANYGWLSYGPTMARVNSITLYPPSEEMSVALSIIPFLEAIY